MLPHRAFARRYIARINWKAQVAAAADRTRRKSDESGGKVPFLQILNVFFSSSFVYSCVPHRL